MRRFLSLLLTAGASITPSVKAQFSPSVTLTLDTPHLSGDPGETVGWGFTLEFSDTLQELTGSPLELVDIPSGAFLLVTAAQFVLPDSAGLLDGTFGVPPSASFGAFTDFAGPAFIVLGPSPEAQVFSQTFNNTLVTGVGSFAINASAIAGVTDSVTPTTDSTGQLPGVAIGAIRVYYDLYSVSPNDLDWNPDTSLISSSNAVLATATVTIVPEPGTTAALLGAAALIAVGVGRRFRRQSQAARAVS